MLKAYLKKYQLRFKKPVLTSRGQMKIKNGYYLFISDGNQTGAGECSFIEGLSIDNLVSYETTLQKLCDSIQSGEDVSESPLSLFPSIQFGAEVALLDFQTGGNRVLFESEFTMGHRQIPVNGLVWMGKKDFMLEQIQEKLSNGFTCIKIKVGAIDFSEEVELLGFIRSKFPPDIIQIRLDANGAFHSNDVFKKLETLSGYHIHSIEQPVKKGQTALMKNVCRTSPIPVALDEELMGIPESEREALLQEIRPRYIILKPSLLGGFKACDNWISLAIKHNIQWWATSALESNIGLNAIAQWVFTKHNSLTQGLGTGELYENNIASPLFIAHGNLGYNPQKKFAI